MPQKFNLLSKDPDEIERMWYIRPNPHYKPGWLVYSRGFILETLQGCLYSPEKVKQNGVWNAAATLLLACVAVGQFTVMLFSWLPVVSWFTYMLARNFPRNAVGFFLRACYWKTRLGFLGVDTLIDQGVEFTNANLIRIGNRCHIDRDVLMSVGHKPGYIVLGDHVFVGPLSHIAGRGGVEIGPYVGISAKVHIYSVTNIPYHLERLGELTTMSHACGPDQQSTVTGKVTIGPYAILGLGAMILPGVSIGTGAVIHAYSEVTESAPKFAIISGHGRGVQSGWRRPGKLDPRIHSTAKD